MSPPVRGNPFLQIRLEPAMLDKLRAVAGEGAGGKKGGVSHFARRLIYREMREPLDESDLADLQDLAAKVEDRATVADLESARDLFRRLSMLASDDPDQIRRTYAQQILGDLVGRMDDAGMVAFSERVTPLSGDGPGH